MRFVLNRADSRVGITRDDVVSIVGRTPDIAVPSDRDIPRSINEGQPIVRAKPRSEAAKAFRSLASMYNGDEAAAHLRTAAAAAQPAREEGLMELHERLSATRPVVAADGRDPFAELKNRIHLTVIGELGPQLFNANMDPTACATGAHRHQRAISPRSRAFPATTASGSLPRSRTTSSGTAHSSGFLPMTA